MKISNLINEINSSPTLEMDTKVKEMIASGQDIINMSVGEPDIDTPIKGSYMAIKGITNKFTKYTNPSGILPLKEKLRDKLLRDNGLDYDVEDIIISNGGKHSLYNAIITVCNPEDEVIILAPFWVSYIEQLKLARAVPKVIYTDESTDFKITKDILEKNITSKTKAIILNSPSNPTGAVYTKSELMDLVDVIKKYEIYIISDEIYEKINYEEDYTSIASLDSEIKERTITINGFSKAYGMTGWRLGYLTGPKNVISGIKKFQGHVTSNVNSIAQLAAIGALECDTNENKEIYKKRMEYSYNRISNISGVKCFRPQGAFYLFPNIKKYFGKKYKDSVINNAEDFSSLLLENNGVAVVSGRGFGSPDNIRISYSLCEEQLIKGIDGIEDFIKNIK